MMRGILTVFTFLSAIFLPWPFTACVAIGISALEPLVPFAVGIFLDTLYYTTDAHRFPLFALSGAIASLIAVYVRSKILTGV